ncbi:MAG: SspB family protein [Kiloniellaceae bacterium]
MTEEIGNDSLRYDRMVEDALRSVVRRALIHAGEHGLPGNHHFYITFRTNHPESEIPEALRERYPGEMTIVLQHQFWGLEISEDRFCVTLSFADVPHRLVVPFAAVTAFADPSVRFGLQFDVESDDAKSGPVAAGDAVTLFEDDTATERDEDDDAMAPVEGEKQSGEKVVTLDAFRKK